MAVSMHLLVTNDDGLGSVFLLELVHALRAAGHRLLVAAPAGEQSWIGAAKSRHRPVRSAPADRGFGCPTWAIDGTPSDCVNIALAHLLAGDAPPIDAVVSGINIGRNTSLAFILASGTVGGAWEGALHGLPAVAISQDIPLAAFAQLRENAGRPEPELLATVRLTAQLAAQHAPELLAATTPRSFTVHNLNFPYPARADSPLRRTVPAHNLLPRLFAAAEADGMHRFAFNPGRDLSPPDLPTDVAAVAAGAISHTVLDYRRLGH
ncbi:MAG: 5'/3'-nucleotidase SurE [Opitutaceae bacterium]